LLEPVGDGAVAASLVGVEHRVDVAAGELDADGADAGVALPAALGALEAVGGELGALAAGEPLTGLVQRGLAALLRARGLAGLDAQVGQVVAAGGVALLAVLAGDPALDAALGDAEGFRGGPRVRAAALGGAESADDHVA